MPRNLRLCDVCGQLDDHPRHVLGVPPGYPGAVPDDAFLDSIAPGAPVRAVAELMDPTTIVRHMPCCAANGCLICTEVISAAGGATGSALLASIEAGSVDHLSTDPETGV